MSTVPKLKVKRKKLTLTLQKKLEILNQLKCGRSATSIAHEYGIGNSTVGDIKRAGPQLRQFAQKHHPFVTQGKKHEEGPKIKNKKIKK